MIDVGLWHGVAIVVGAWLLFAAGVWAWLDWQCGHAPLYDENERPISGRENRNGGGRIWL